MKVKNLFFGFYFVFLFLNLFSCTNEPENIAISSDGLEIRFDVQGEGDPTLIFIHGYCCDRKYWDESIRSIPRCSHKRRKGALIPKIWQE